MRDYARIIIFLGTLLFLNTAAFAKPPTWVNGRSNRYPSGLYLVGVGQSNSDEGARADALAALAKIFHAQISQQTAEWQKYIQVESKGKSSVEQKQSIESLTKVSTDKTLEGAEIVEAAQDGAIYYALGVIDRLQATATLTERIAGIDQKINESLAVARQSTDKLEKIKNFKRAIKAFLLRDAYNTDLQVVNIKGGGIVPPVSLTSVAAEYEKWLSKNFLVEVEMSGAKGESVRKAIIDGLIREGFSVKGKASGGDDYLSDLEGPLGTDLLVKGEVSLSPVDLPGQPFKYVRWCVDLEVLEPKYKRIVGVVAKSGREGHVSASEAEARALRALVPEVSIDIGSRLAEYLGGDYQPQERRASSCAGLTGAPPAPATPTVPVPPAQAPPEAAPPPQSTPAKMGPFYNCQLSTKVRTVLDTVEIVDPSIHFPQSTGDIHLVCELDPHQDFYFYYRLVAEAVENVKTERLIKRTYDGVGENALSAHHEIPQPEGGWPKGTYRIDLYESRNCGSDDACTTNVYRVGALHFQITEN